MAFEERGTWLNAAVALGSFIAYVVILLGRARGVPLHSVAYVAPMLWTIGGGIVAGIAGKILVGLAWCDDCGRKDVRDIDIERFGDRIGQSFGVLAGVTALGMAMAEVDHFWIAHVIYVGFMMSALLTAAMKILAYRRGIPDC